MADVTNKSYLMIGDIVRLRAASDPLMTVKKLLAEDDLVECAWCDGEEWHQGHFAAARLEFVKAGVAPAAGGPT